MRTSNGVLGLQVVVVDQGRLETVSTGKRNVISAGQVTEADQFQIGSLSKAASAIPIARLVEQKKLRWDSSMAEMFPAWSGRMHASMRSVTVQQLLRHRVGLQRDIKEADAVMLRTQGRGDSRADRALLGKYYLERPPALTPDSAYAYSNVGYLVVGLVAEAVTGEGYPGLMEKEVFAPMAMMASLGLPEDAGAGALSGHTFSADSRQVAQYGAETRPWLGLMYPAGGMMVGIDGQLWQIPARTSARLAGQVDNAEPGNVQTDSHAGGRLWFRVGGGRRCRARRRVQRTYGHSGTIGTYYSNTMIITATGRAIAVSCKCGGPSASGPVDKLVTSLTWAKP